MQAIGLLVSLTQLAGAIHNHYSKQSIYHYDVPTIPDRLPSANDPETPLEKSLMISDSASNVAPYRQVLNELSQKCFENLSEVVTIAKHMGGYSPDPKQINTLERLYLLRAKVNQFDRHPIRCFEAYKQLVRESS